jgi:hypothetical protein
MILITTSNRVVDTRGEEEVDSGEDSREEVVEGSVVGEVAIVVVVGGAPGDGGVGSNLIRSNTPCSKLLACASYEEERNRKRYCSIHCLFGEHLMTVEQYLLLIMHY